MYVYRYTYVHTYLVSDDAKQTRSIHITHRRVGNNLMIHTKQYDWDLGIIIMKGI
jgi:hypothetical protein